MTTVNRTNDEIYKAVSNFHKNKRLSKHDFIKRLKMIRSLIDGEEKLNESVEWLFVTEEIEFCNGFTDNEVRNVKKKIREEIKGILSLLNIKTSRNQLIDEKETENSY